MKPITPAERTDHIEYAIRDIVVLADELRKQGKEILPLNIGDPLKYDFEAPAHMIEATYMAMKENHNGYAPAMGIDEALTAINETAGKNGIQNIQSTFITTGASEAIELCLTALLNPGENILTPFPGYPLYTAIQHKLCAEENPYYLDEENGWQPDLGDIEKRINDKTRGIVLINPNNPTGAVYRKEVLEGILELARKHNLIIFSDEIYDRLILDDIEYTSIASMDPEVPVVTLNGISKAYLACGWRIGWGILSGNKDLVADYDEAVKKLLRARLCAAYPFQFSIKPALEGDQSHIDVMKEKLRSRRDITYDRLNAIRGISCQKPEGAFYAFPKLDMGVPDEKFVKHLLRETGIITVHGSGFGQKPGTEHLRIVFLPDENILNRSYDKLEEFVKKHYS